MAIAFSGGLDSRFLAFTAACLSRREKLALPRLAHVTGPHIPAQESEEARLWAAKTGLELVEVGVNPLEFPDVAANGRERCYYCKRALFGALFDALRRGGGEVVLCDGSNASDHEGYRPGLRALRELGIRSPLDEAGLTKPNIRILAASTGMDRPEQAARPCLLTRFPYGMRPTLEALQRLEALEAKLARLLADEGKGAPDFRIRMREDGGLLLQLGPDGDDALEARLIRGLNVPDITVLRTEKISGYFDSPAPEAACRCQPGARG